MDAAALLTRKRLLARALYRPLGTASPGSRVLELDGGVLAAVVPARPERSICNAVVYLDPAAVTRALEDLARAYDDAGVIAWTVWVGAGDRDVADALAAAGHVLDGSPMAMAAPIETLDLAPRTDLELMEAPDWETVARLNDRAYGIPPAETFATALAGIDDPALRLYVAVVDGRPAACTVASRHGRDCGIYFVATLPEARGRGLASELMRTALREAGAEGCTTTFLEASAMGEPVYAAMGYRPFGRVELWERRRGT